MLLSVNRVGAATATSFIYFAAIGSANSTGNRSDVLRWVDPLIGTLNGGQHNRFAPFLPSTPVDTRI